jgi:hypothetical protein
MHAGASFNLSALKAELDKKDGGGEEESDRRLSYD